MPKTSAFLLLLLTGCATSPDYVAPQLPAAGDGLAACTAVAVPEIPGARGTPLGKAEAAEALAAQRASALSKDRCAKAWAEFYSDLSKSIGGEAPKNGR
ncbi:MAG: hypothetical protein WCA78_08895 [Rhizomicrobium sp.]